MSDDIVTRLRHWANGAAEQEVQDVVDGLNFAADEIERLRVQALGIQRRIQDQDAIMAELWERIHALTDEIERLRRNTGCARNQGTTQFCAEALDAQREAERLRAERDHAVREAAEARQTIYRLQHELAGCSRAPADGKHTAAGETFIPEAL